MSSLVAARNSAPRSMPPKPGMLERVGQDLFYRLADVARKTVAIPMPNPGGELDVGVATVKVGRGNRPQRVPISRRRAARRRAKELVHGKRWDVEGAGWVSVLTSEPRTGLRSADGTAVRRGLGGVVFLILR